LKNAPAWMSLSNFSYLVIAAPNDIHIVGKYKFWVGIWQVTLEIDASCIGIDEITTQVSVYIDKVVIINLAYRLDEKGQSWKKVCGSN